MPVVGALVLLAGCGEPPPPPSTAPPEPSGSPSLGASASAYPPGVVPTVPTTVPTAVLPPVPLPAATVPTLPYTPPATTTPTPTTTTSRTPGPPPAPRCTAGPSAAQVIGVVEGTAGIPERELKVVQGPFCSGTWQFSAVEIVPRGSEEKFELLFVVTTGTPAALQLVEAGTDVCSGRVQNDAPTGIRVRACGA